jgi:hypothetical protein
MKKSGLMSGVMKKPGKGGSEGMVCPEKRL